MKEKIKNTKGITLVALIITIIVLLILAVVAITSINNNKILEYAKNGRDAYNQGRTNETNTITEYEKYLEDNNPQKTNAEVEWGCYKDTERNGIILFYLGTNDKVTIKSTDKILAYIGDLDEYDNFVPTTKTETIELVSLKDNKNSEISLKDNTVIKDITVDKEMGESIQMDFPGNIEIVKFLDGKTKLIEFNGYTLLKELYIPSTITEIEEYCFMDCGTDTTNGKTTIIYNGTKKQWDAIDKKMKYASGITVKCTDGDLTIQ